MSFIGAPYQNTSEGLPLEREVIQSRITQTKKQKKQNIKNKSTKPK